MAGGGLPGWSYLEGAVARRPTTSGSIGEEGSSLRCRLPGISSISIGEDGGCPRGELVDIGTPSPRSVAAPTGGDRPWAEWPRGGRWRNDWLRGARSKIWHPREGAPTGHKLRPRGSVAPQIRRPAEPTNGQLAAICAPLVRARREGEEEGGGGEAGGAGAGLPLVPE